MWRSSDLVLAAVLLLLAGDWMGYAGAFALERTDPAARVAAFVAAEAAAGANLVLALSKAWSPLAVIGAIAATLAWGVPVYAVEFNTLSVAYTALGLVLGLLGLLHSRAFARYGERGR